MMTFFGKWLCSILAIIFIFFGVARPIKAQGPTNFANCRLGVTGPGDVTDYNIQQFNIGLYLDFRSRSSPPPGLPADVEYIQMVRVKQVKDCDSKYCDAPYVEPPTYTVSPDFNTIDSRARSLTGALWLIGNEMERRDWNNEGTWDGQDEITAELYAKAFHEIRDVIKNADPTAKISLAGMVQPTPLRLEYLDRVWDTYSALYGYSMGHDIDVWNIHGFIFREVREEWGADTPAGFDDDTNGFLNPSSISLAVAAHHDIEIFQKMIEGGVVNRGGKNYNLEGFRVWMADHGERDKPLIITEYATLFGANWISQQETIDYLTATFDYMLTATDGSVGYPADGNKLVQGWLWFKLTSDYKGSSLFNSTTKNLTDVGQAWKNYVEANTLTSQAKPNLLVTNLGTAPNPAFVPSSGDSVDLTLSVDISNGGNINSTTGNAIMVKFWDGPPNVSGSNQIGSTQIIEDLLGCGRQVKTVEIEWADVEPGGHTWYVEIVPIANETDENDNVASMGIQVFGGEVISIYLPTILKQSR